MKFTDIHALLMEYGQSHLNPINERCHAFGIPLIFYGVFGLIFKASPTALIVVIILLLSYYAYIARHLAVGAVVAAAVLCVLVFLTELTLGWPTLIWYSVIFVLGWVLQFLGHRAEGNKPSFFGNPIFLIIGPMWLMHKLYRQFGWKSE